METVTATDLLRDDAGFSSGQPFGLPYELLLPRQPNLSFSDIMDTDARGASLL